MNYLMNKFIKKAETVILWMLFGTPLALIGFVAGGFLTAVLTEEKYALAMALVGLAFGIILDVVFLRRPVKNAYRINNKILIALYIFYSIGALGFCMGVPILNFGVGIVAGFYTARKTLMYKSRPDTTQPKHQKNRNLFSHNYDGNVLPDRCMGSCRRNGRLGIRVPFHIIYIYRPNNHRNGYHRRNAIIFIAILSNYRRR